MIQHIIIFLIFLAAAVYVARLFYRMFSNNSSGCPKGCGTCSTIDIKKIEADIQRRQAMVSTN